MENNLDNSMILTLFGEQVKNFRTKQYLTQAELAEKSHLHRNSIVLIENGKQNPTLTLMYKLSFALNVTLTDLVADLCDTQKTKS